MNHAPSRAMALQATLHCLLGCSIGEVAGMMLGASFGWPVAQTVIVSVCLAFLTGFALSVVPLVRRGIPLGRSLRLVAAADTLSIMTMEVVNNAVMVAMPGAMAASLLDAHFWVSMSIALVAAFIVAYPVNLYLLGRGKGHALTHHFMHDDNDHHHKESHHH